MEQRAYYSVENLTTLKAENNSLFTQMVAVTEQVYRLCQPEKTTVITTVTFMDVVEYLDLLDDLSKLLYNINQFLKSSSADRFFTVSPIINSGALRQRLLSCCIRRRLHGKAGLRQCRKVIRYRGFTVLPFYRFHISFSYGFLRQHCLSSASRNKKVISSRIRSHSPCQVSLTRNPSSFW